MLSFDQWAPQTGSESDPYNLGDAWGGMRQGDLSQTDVLQQLYQKAMNPAWGTQGRTLQEMTGGSGDAFFNSLDRVNGKMRVGDNLGSFSTDPYAMDIIRRNGGMGALTSYDPTYGNLFDVSSPGGAQAYQQLSDLGDKRHNTLNDQAWFNIVKLAAMAAGGAYAGAAGAGAEAGGSAVAAGAGAEAGGAVGGSLAEAGGASAADGAANFAGAQATGELGTGGAMDVSPIWGELGGMTSGGEFGMTAADGAAAFEGATATADGGSSMFQQLAQKFGMQAAQQLMKGMTGSGGSALGNIFGGNGGAGDWASLLGGLGSSALSYNAAQTQANSLKDMQNQYLSMGAPYRARLDASYQPGFSMDQDPGYKGAMDASSNAVLRGLSAQGGNPFDNPGGLMEANRFVMNNTALPALQNYRSQLGTFGQFGSAQSGQLGQDSIQARANGTNALTGGINQFTQPQSPFGNMPGLGGLRLNMGSGY